MPRPYRVIVPTLYRGRHEVDFSVGGTEESPRLYITIYQSGENFYFGAAGSRSQYVNGYADKKSVGSNKCEEADALIEKYWDAEADAHIAAAIRKQKLSDIDYIISGKQREVNSTKDAIARAARLALILPTQEAELAALEAQRAAI